MAKDFYTYAGPVYKFGTQITPYTEMDTWAQSLAQAVNNFRFQAARWFEEDVRAISIDRSSIKFQYSSDDELSYEDYLDLQKPAEPRCEHCGTKLNASGECPVCDLGEEDYNSDDSLDESFDKAAVKDKVIDLLKGYKNSRFSLFEVDHDEQWVDHFDDVDIDFCKFSEHEQQDYDNKSTEAKYYSFMITGGLNGDGEWDEYLEDIRKLFIDFQDKLHLDPVLYQIDTDVADDVWVGKVFLYEDPTEAQLKESLLYEHSTPISREAAADADMVFETKDVLKSKVKDWMCGEQPYEYQLEDIPENLTWEELIEAIKNGRMQEVISLDTVPQERIWQRACELYYLQTGECADGDFEKLINDPEKRAQLELLSLDEDFKNKSTGETGDIVRDFGNGYVLFKSKDGKASQVEKAQLEEVTPEETADALKIELTPQFKKDIEDLKAKGREEEFKWFFADRGSASILRTLGLADAISLDKVEVETRSGNNSVKNPHNVTVYALKKGRGSSNQFRAYFYRKGDTCVFVRGHIKKQDKNGDAEYRCIQDTIDDYK